MYTHMTCSMYLNTHFMCTVHLGTLEYLITTCTIPNLPANLLIALPIPTPQNTNLWPHCQRVILPPHTCLQPRSTCSTLGFGTFVPSKQREEKKTNNHVSPPHLNGATDRSDIVEEQITYIFPPLSLGFNRNDVNAFPPENTWQHTNNKKTKQQKKHQQNKRWL